MDNHLLVSLVGALVNAVLVLVVPCVLQKTNLPYSDRISKAFGKNREVIISSSVVVAVVIYISLNITPTIKQETPLPILNFLNSMPF